MNQVYTVLIKLTNRQRLQIQAPLAVWKRVEGNAIGDDFYQGRVYY